MINTINIRSYILLLIISPLLFSCTKKEEGGNHLSPVQNEPEEGLHLGKDLQDTIFTVDKREFESVPDTGFVVLNRYVDGFDYEMKYATSDNFLKKAVYSCDECLVRKEVADALKKANDSLIKRGYRIKFFDCYRPEDVQKQMWEIFPDSRYVANPNTTGSIHNKGGAVDITLVNLKGRELDMGTGFDHFEKEAHHGYTNLPDTVLANRQLLKNTMENFGFRSIKTEWWHYNFNKSHKYGISNFQVECE